MSILGYESEEIKEMGDDIIKILMHPKDYDTYINKTLPKYKRLKDKILKSEYRMKHKNGRWVRLISTEVIYKRDEKGNPTQIIGTIIKK